MYVIFEHFYFESEFSFRGLQAYTHSTALFLPCFSSSMLSTDIGYMQDVKNLVKALVKTQTALSSLIFISVGSWHDASAYKDQLK